MASSELPHDRPLRVLLIDDDEEDYFLTREILNEIPGGRFVLDWADAYGPGLEGVCRGEHDVYLLDYRLGPRNGLDLLKEAKERCWVGPVIFLTGLGEAEIDRAAMEAGAADFLEKARLDATILERSIRYALQQRRYELELERKVAERTEALARANDALREADRRKNDFLAVLAHELRNPLASVHNAVKVMGLAASDPAVVEEARAVTERQVRHLARLIDDLLDVSRITRGKVHLRPGPCDLREVARQTAGDYRPVLEEAGLSLTITVPERPVWVHGDVTRLSQVVGNLLHNAHKFTDAGGAVTVSVTEDRGLGVLRVRDTGTGIAAEVLPKLFEPFNQADRTLDRSSGGLGLGLALARGLIELHGGDIGASSGGPGKGSEFVIRLPLGPPPGPAAAPAPSEGQAEARRILIVEDIVDAAQSLKMLLALLGHKVEVAHSGPTGLKAAESFGPEVVLCDIGLPGMDGYAVARALRRGPETAGVLLIALSGYGQEEDQRCSREAGFDAHLTKPVDLDELRRLLTSGPSRAR